MRNVAILGDCHRIIRMRLLTKLYRGSKLHKRQHRVPTFLFAIICNQKCFKHFVVTTKNVMLH